jgi:hypothetical protein
MHACGVSESRNPFFGGGFDWGLRREIFPGFSFDWDGRDATPLGPESHFSGEVEYCTILYYTYYNEHIYIYLNGMTSRQEGNHRKDIHIPLILSSSSSSSQTDNYPTSHPSPYPLLALLPQQKQDTQEPN